MKQVVSGLLALVLVAPVVVLTTTSKNSVRAVHAQSGCSVATLKGAYGLTDSGFSALNTRGTAQFPIAGVGVIGFDGAGNASGSFTVSFNGKTTADNLYTGTYTVNSDCSGLLTSTSGADNFAFVIVGGGADVLATDVSPGATASLELKKQ
jgi:hypothetical protein